MEKNYELSLKAISTLANQRNLSVLPVPTPKNFHSDILLA